MRGDILDGRGSKCKYVIMRGDGEFGLMYGVVLDGVWRMELIREC